TVIRVESTGTAITSPCPNEALYTHDAVIVGSGCRVAQGKGTRMSCAIGRAGSLQHADLETDCLAGVKRFAGIAALRSCACLVLPVTSFYNEMAGHGGSRMKFNVTIDRDEDGVWV